MAVTVDVELNIKIEEAVRATAQASKEMTKQLRTIETQSEKTSSAVKTISFIEIYREVKALGGQIIGFFQDVVGEALEADNAIQGLTSSLRNAGDFSDRNVAVYKNLAEELSNVSRYSDDLILDQVRLGKQFNLTNRETEKLIRAAVDAAPALRQGLGETVRQLGQTFDGTAGSLREQVPELRGLSKEALRSGAALDIVIKKFGGAALRDLNTFEGALEKTKNSFSDIFEEMGNGIVQNESFVVAIREIGVVFKTVADVIGNNGPMLKDILTDSLIFAAKAAGVLALTLRALDFILTALFIPVQVLGAVLETVFKSLYNLARLDFKGLKESLNFVKTIERDAAETNRALAARRKIYDGIATVTAGLSVQLEGMQKATEGTQKAADATAKTFDKLATKTKRVIITEEERLKIHDEYLKNLEKEKALVDEIYEKHQAQLKERTSNPFSSIRGTNTLGADVATQNATATGIGIASNVAQGRQGAVNLISQGAELAGQYFLGVPGVGQLASLLSQGPEVIKEMVKQFADAIPDVIQAIAESIPVIMETLAEKLPDIITKLVEKAPDIIFALVKTMPLVGFALAKAAVSAGAQFVREVLGGAAQFVAKILEGAGKFIEELISGIGKVGEKLNPFGEGGLGGFGDNLLDSVPGLNFRDGIQLNDFIPGGGFLPDIGGDLFNWKGGGFQKGGAGAAGSSSRPMQVNVSIGQRQLATAMLDVKRQGFRTT